MRGAWSIYVFAFAVVLPMGVNARAPGVKTLTDVEFAASGDRIEFTLVAEPPLTPDEVSARADGAVLMVRAEGTRADRRWLTTPDDQIKRTLLHPSRKNAPAAIVRTRLTGKVAKAVLGGIRVRQEGPALIVSIPRTAAVAQRWAAAGAAPIANQPVDQAGGFRLTFDADRDPTPHVPPAIAAPDTPAIPTALAATAAADVPAAIAAAPDAVAADAVAADVPQPTGEDVPLAIGADDGGDIALSTGLGQPSTDGPGMVAYLMSLLFLGVIGLVMWRKMRGASSVETGRPIIKAVGSHMLGPKQNLLLVDVAGEMVLLGTSDKGVQMLTKIQARPDAPVSDAVRPGPEVPADAMPGAETFAGFNLAERLGAAVSRFRSAAARIESPKPADADESARPSGPPQRAMRYAQHAERAAEEMDAAIHGADHDPLTAMADRVVDAPEIDDRRHARRNFEPVRTETRPARTVQPPPDPSADLLRRIRALQRA